MHFIHKKLPCHLTLTLSLRTMGFSRATLGDDARCVCLAEIFCSSLDGKCLSLECLAQRGCHKRSDGVFRAQRRPRRSLKRPWIITSKQAIERFFVTFGEPRFATLSGGGNA